MATRSQKAAKKRRETAAKEAKAGQGKDAAPRAAKAKGRASPARSKKGQDGPTKPARRRKQPTADAEAPAQEAAMESAPAEEGFLVRWRERRAAKARARDEERVRREQEREEQRMRDEAQRRLEEEQRRRLEEEQAALRAEAERQAEAERKAEERKAAAAAKRAEAKAAKEEAARRAAEEAEAKARAAEEAKLRRAEERKAKRAQMEAEEARLAAEQARKDAEEEAEREAEARRKAQQKRLQEPEPDMEFEEPSAPVAKGSEMVPTARGSRGEVDVQADRVAVELARRRSKPVVIVEDEPPAPRIPKAPLREGETEEPVRLAARGRGDDRLTPEEAAARAAEANAAAAEAFGFTVPEAFLLLANAGGWDERVEKGKPGALGGPLAGAMVLELLVAGAVMVQRDRIVLTGTVPDDPALGPVLDRLRRIREKKGDVSSLRQMGLLAKANRDLLEPFKQALADKGLVRYGRRKHLGLFHRSWVEVLNVDAQERLQNKLRRAIAGGGTPEAHSVLLLGLLDASGLFATVVPDEAADYNRKRLNGLLGGRDIMGYKVDPRLKGLQEVAVRTVLNNARLMTTRG